MKKESKQEIIQEEPDGGAEKSSSVPATDYQRKSERDKDIESATKLAVVEKREKTVKFDENLDELIGQEDMGPIEQTDQEKEEQEMKNLKIQEEVDAAFSKRYQDKELYRVFALIFTASVLVNVDHGSLPGCSPEVMKKFHTDNFGFGSLGTMVYAGLTLGATIGTKVYQDSKNIQVILCGSLLMNALCLTLFTLSSNFKLNLCIRFITGIFQVFISIFTPVWADAFGSDKLKSMWITILLIASPSGIFIGFTLTSIMNALLTWEWSFWIQSISVVPVAIAIYYQDRKYLNLDEAVAYRQKCQERVEARILKEETKKLKELENTVSYQKQQKKAKEDAQRAFLRKNRDLQNFLELRSKISMNDGKFNAIQGQHSARGSVRDMGYGHGRSKFNDGTMSIRSGQRKSQDGRSERKSVNKDGTITYQDDESFHHEFAQEQLSFWEIVKTLMSNSEYFLLMLSQTGFYYVVAGIQYWCPNYLELILKVDVTKATIYFSITCFLAPVTGVIVGGIVTSYYGGYSKRKVKEIVLMVGWTCVFVTVPIPYVDGFAPFGTLLYLMLFMGGFILPSLTGIMLNSVQQHQRGSANSVAQLSNSLLGFMPAPAIYGYFQDLLNKDDTKPKSRVPMMVILYSVLVTLTCCTIAILRKIKVEHQKTQLGKAEEIFQKQQEEEDEEQVSLIRGDDDPNSNSVGKSLSGKANSSKKSADLDNIREADESQQQKVKEV